MTYQEGRRVLVEAREVDCPYDSAINAPYVSFQRGSGGTTTLHIEPTTVHSAPPEWAQPWPDGVWLTTIAEVRDRGLWWRGLNALVDISAAPDAPATWFTTPPSWSDHETVLAREPIPQRRSVIIDLPEDATDAEIVAAWRTGGAA